MTKSNRMWLIIVMGVIGSWIGLSIGTSGLPLAQSILWESVGHSVFTLVFGYSSAVEQLKDYPELLKMAIPVYQALMFRIVSNMLVGGIVGLIATALIVPVPKETASKSEK